MRTDAEQSFKWFIETYNRLAIENDRETRYQEFDTLKPDVRENLLETFQMYLQQLERWNRE